MQIENKFDTDRNIRHSLRTSSRRRRGRPAKDSWQKNDNERTNEILIPSPRWLTYVNVRDGKGGWGGGGGGVWSWSGSWVKKLKPHSVIFAGKYDNLLIKVSEME